MEIETVDIPSENVPEHSYKRLWCAFLSAAIPGLGDWPLGNKGRGRLFLAVFLTSVLCYWPLRLPRFYWPFLALMIVGMVLNIASGWYTF